MSDKDSYEFYVGKGTVLQGASLEISGTAKIDGTIVGTVGVNHLIVGPTGVAVSYTHLTLPTSDLV